MFAEIADNLPQAFVVGFTMGTTAELIIQQAFEVPPLG
jgi:hypothetical protein